VDEEPTMKKLIAILAAASLLVPTFAAADGGHNRHGKRGGPPHGYYYPYQPYGYHHGYHYDDDSDEALWAIGGLMLGTIIGSAATRRVTGISAVATPAETQGRDLLRRSGL
jgi:hypothetical protein